MPLDILRVANHFCDAPQQRLHGDTIESNHKSITCRNSPLHIQTLVAEYRNPKHRHASVNCFLRAQQSTVRNEQSDVKIIYRTHGTQLEIQIYKKVENTFSLFPSMYVTVSLSAYLSIYLFAYNSLSIYVSIYLSMHIYLLPLDPSTYLLIYPSINLFFIHPPKTLINVKVKISHQCEITDKIIFLQDLMFLLFG
jgi:hypothetical protein